MVVECNNVVGPTVVCRNAPLHLLSYVGQGPHANLSQLLADLPLRRCLLLNVALYVLGHLSRLSRFFYSTVLQYSAMSVGVNLVANGKKLCSVVKQNCSVSYTHLRAHETDSYLV